MDILRIKDELLDLGILPQYRAFIWIARAIQICMEDCSIRENPSGQLYDQLSQEYQTESTIILQAMRRAVWISWRNRKAFIKTEEKFKEIFKAREENNKAPRPLEFIVRMSDYLKERENNNATNFNK